MKTSGRIVAFLCVLLGIALGVGRIWIGVNFEPRSASLLLSYEAVAHVFWGAMFATWISAKFWNDGGAFWAGAIAFYLAVLEVAVAVLVRL